MKTRNKKTVLEAAIKASQKLGKPGVTLFRMADGPAFTTVNRNNSFAAEETLNTIKMLGGEPAFSIIPPSF